MRELNEGVQRIYDEMASFFLNDPVFSEPNDSSVLLTLENSITSRVLRQSDTVSSIVGEDAYRALTEPELSAVQIVYARGKVTVKQLSEHLERSAKFARSTLRGLVGKGILSWHGSGPEGPVPVLLLPPLPLRLIRRSRRPGETPGPAGPSG